MNIYFLSNFISEKRKPKDQKAKNTRTIGRSASSIGNASENNNTFARSAAKQTMLKNNDDGDAGVYVIYIRMRATFPQKSKNSQRNEREAKKDDSGKRKTAGRNSRSPVGKAFVLKDLTT